MLDENILLSKFENEDFQFYSTNWWPLIRIQVAYQLELKIANATKSIRKEQDVFQKTTKLSLKDQLKYYSSKFKSYKPISNLIVTDSYHKIIMNHNNKSKINPYTNPFLDVFNELALDYTLFDISSNEFPSNFEAHSLKKVYANKVKSKFNKDVKFQSQLKQLCKFLKETYGQDFNLLNHLVNNIITNQTNYLVFLQLLKKTKTKKILLYCYYNNTMMSIIRAANHLKVDVIEYQHSQVTSNHFAYCKWNSKNNNFQNFFPSAIWVWRKSDAEYLANQFKDKKNITFLVGGNLYLNSFKKERNKTEEQQIKVLITLQGFGIPEYVVSVLDEFPNLVYYLRMHPRYVQDRDVLETLKSKYNEQIEINEANNTNLFELFNYVDYHLTYFSGSAIEASYFNIPNIIYGEKGFLTFQKEIESKEYFFIKNHQELREIFLHRKKNEIVSENFFEDTKVLINKYFN